MEWDNSLQWQLINNHETKASTYGNISVRQANCPFLEERGPGSQLSSFFITRVSTLGKWHLKELPFGKGKNPGAGNSLPISPIL